MNSAFSQTAEHLVKTDEGWTIFKASQESIIVYVSSSEGNDETGMAYTTQDIGDDPFIPDRHIVLKPFKTFKSAFNKTRNNKPDWILIKRGDSLFESINVRNGKSLTEPFLIATYGINNSNPIFNTADKIALQICCSSSSNIAIQGLDFYAHTRDPKSLSYISSKGHNGINIYVNKGHSIKNILFEGNRFKFYTSNVIQGPGSFENIILRRNSFFDNYSTISHSQGLYAANISVTLEENIFDHNGWLKQAGKNTDKAQGAATIFNHNTYFTDANDVIFSNNMFIRSSSMHNKWTANKGKNSSNNILIKNNLYIDGEIGISAGGNKSGAYRFKNYQIINNVMLNIGRSQPTNRGISWGIEIKDWDGGVIKNNYFLNQISPQVNNTYGIHISGTSQNVLIKKNTFNNLSSGNALVLAGNGIKKNIFINYNKFSFTERGGPLIKTQENLVGYLFEGNQYFHASGPDKTYAMHTKKINFWQKIFSSSNDGDFLNWIILTKEQTKQFSKPNIKEQRTIETYLKSIHKKATIDSLISEVRSMSFKNWDQQFTAKQINKYIKLGYTNNEYISK